MPLRTIDYILGTVFFGAGVVVVAAGVCAWTSSDQVGIPLVVGGLSGLGWGLIHMARAKWNLSKY